MAEAQARQRAKEALILHKAGAKIVQEASKNAIEYVQTNIIMGDGTPEERAKTLDEHALYMGVAVALEELAPLFKDMKKSLTDVDEDRGTIYHKLIMAHTYTLIHKELKKYEE